MKLSNKMQEILREWQEDFRGAVDITEFQNEEELVDFLIETIPVWIKIAKENKYIEDVKLYEYYLNKLQ